MRDHCVLHHRCVENLIFAVDNVILAFLADGDILLEFTQVNVVLLIGSLECLLGWSFPEPEVRLSQLSFSLLSLNCTELVWTFRIKI
jgi:hypothetical protein